MFESKGTEGGDFEVAGKVDGGGGNRGIDVEKNDAVEGERPEEELFRSIFGSDGEEE